MIVSLVVVLYFLSLLFIFLFSLGQLHLTWLYLRSKKAPKQLIVAVSPSLPFVTIQLPVYNELYVVERLLDNISKICYPLDKLEIQVLDDSNDETIALIADKVEQLKMQGLDIHHLRRKQREGYKAGALQYGLKLAKGELIAIFDADFLPKEDFLAQTVDYFQDPNIGVVQTRWGHINESYSILTKLQAFALDAHFSIEQRGRNFSKSFINFNGTGGVWRKSCIVDAGGWSADTLTEDLDLSYRAQLKGWKFIYLQDVVAPAELPVFMPAIKSQQFRWNKGAAETAKKNLIKVISSKLPFTTKLHAFFHLLNSSMFLCLLLAAVLSVPMIFIQEFNPLFKVLSNLGFFFLMGFFSISFFYWIATRETRTKNAPHFFKIFPLFLIISMGFSLHNGLAVLEGFSGFKSPFIRTPKFNIIEKKDLWKDKKYVLGSFNFLTLSEGLLSLFFFFAVILGIIMSSYEFLIFHIMLSIGFGLVFFYSISPVNDRH
ncbi:MAG: glycosyltransferase family 2 protein [Bacteroidota bacterium]|nr:glycosyltransferase family 2 protein [Bacteroidota bacterium]